MPYWIFANQEPNVQEKKICRYTAEGREEIQRNLKFDETVMTVLHMLARAYLPNRSVEYMDNRVSLYAAQYGKCAVTGKVLWIDEIHCHHKKLLRHHRTIKSTKCLVTKKESAVQSYLYNVCWAH